MLIYSLYYTHKPGGFCKRLYRLLNAISQNGHEVIYFCLDRPPEVLSKQVKWHKIPFPFKTRSGLIFWLSFSLWTAVYLSFISASKGPRWLVFSPFYSALLVLCKIINSNSIICFIRSKLAKNSSLFVANLADLSIYKLCFLISDRLIVQTRANKLLALQQGCPASKLQILPNDVPVYDIMDRQTQRSGQLKVISSGVFNQKKNLQLLISSWQILEQVCQQRKIECPQLSIAGKLQDSSTEIPASSKINFIAWCENLPAEYRKHDLYLHPSVHEGMPNSLLEAMGCGMAVLVAQTAELLEIVQDSRLCFNPEDPEALANLILKLQADPEYLRELREISCQKASMLRFDWDKAALNLALN